MNILELDSYNLADTVKFHDRLNPRLWDSGEHLRPEVKAKLMEVALDFQEFLGVPDLDVKDITISGSNAAFNYTPASDIDLHIVVDIPAVTHNEVYRELFNAKKYQYNDEHDIRIRGADVELYAQDSKQPHHSQGIYSLLTDQWLSVPKRHKAEIDDVSTRSKFEDLAARIDDTVKSQDVDRMDSLMKKIKTMRQTGLEKQGEFGSDNLAFKLLRNNGYIKKLLDAKQSARDQELSLAELARPRQKVRYGFGESPDGVDPTTKMFLEEPATESPDGVNPTTAMFLTEVNTESIVQEFIQHTSDRLGIKRMPEIIIHHDEDWSESNHSFGMYVPERHELHVSLSNRHLLDVLRTTAHELCHCAQHEQEPLPDNAGDTGSSWENEANAVAGVIMRDFANSHPEYFQQDAIKESASGYIPTRAQAKDPRYSMALTVDIKPGQVGREANKLNLKTDKQGRPALLMKSVNLQESLAREFAVFEASKGREEPWDRDGYEPPGPEFPPQMPAGTTKIDVSDLTDWYRIGMDISDLDDAEPEDYNQGPPQTVITFASDELEQQYLKQFKRLGLKTHDMDPDVEGGEDTTGKHLQQKLAEEFELFEEQDLFEINMSTGSLRQEAAKTGALAGMEFEMIVPNTESSGEDYDQEPDYDYDERCRSIDDMVNFFNDGDWNDRRSVERVAERMRDDYQEWLDEKISEQWESDGEQYIADWVRENVDSEEWLNDEVDAETSPEEKFENFVANVHNDSGSRYYEDAYDQFRDENQESWDESDWLDAEDLDRMSGIENAYSLNWPHWQYQQSGGEASIEDVANDFQDAIGRDVQASGSYHSGRVSRPSPTQQHYVVEPDGSLEADNDNDQGLEFVSPPLPIDQLLSDLNKVKKWAGLYGCYTNDSTGLHINISVPDYSRENLDFVKLALLMGDKYVLDAFGRTGNTYAKSALGIIKDAVRNKPEDAARLLDKMKGNLDQLATKAIHSGITSKYTSINTKDGHIEFRSPGGDWLDDNFDKIENTLLRFTVAMSAALNPDMYRQEYLTKLYKLLSENNKGDDTIKYFSDYVAGKIPKAALRSFVKQAQLERKIKRGKAEGKMWWNVSWDNGRIEVVASDEQEAKDKAFKESYWAPDQPDTPHAQQFRNSLVAKPLRPYEEPTDKATGPTLNGRPSNPDGRWVISPENDRSRVAYRFNAAAFDDANIVRRQWASDNEGVWIVQRDDNRTLGQPSQPATQQPAQNQEGNWGIWIDANNRFANQPGEYSRGEVPPLYRFPSRAAAELWIEQQRAARPNMRADIEVREIEPAEPVPGSTLDLQRQRAAPQGVDTRVDYELYNRATGEVFDTFPARNDDEAMVRLDDFRNFSAQARQNPDLDVGVRRGPGVSAAPGGIIDVEPDVAQNFPQASSAPAGNSFSGQWRVVDGAGRELYVFRGAGNNQADANRIAATWARENNYSGALDVLPVMI